MPRFLVPAIIISLFSAGLLFYLVRSVAPFTGIPPEISISYRPIIALLVALFLFLTSFFSLILYFVSRLLGDYQEPRYVYRKSLRRGALIGLGAVLVAVLLLTRTANILTILLALGLIGSLEITLKR